MTLGPAISHQISTLTGDINVKPQPFFCQAVRLIPPFLSSFLLRPSSCSHVSPPHCCFDPCLLHRCFERGAHGEETSTCTSRDLVRQPQPGRADIREFRSIFVSYPLSSSCSFALIGRWSLYLQVRLCLLLIPGSPSRDLLQRRYRPNSQERRGSRDLLR